MDDTTGGHALFLAKSSASASFLHPRVVLLTGVF